MGWCCINSYFCLYLPYVFFSPHAWTKASWISDNMGPRLKKMNSVKSFISNTREWINFSCAFVWRVSLRMGWVSAVTGTSPNSQGLTYTSWYRNHATCMECIGMDFCTISVSGTQDDRKAATWNILGPCNRKKESRESFRSFALSQPKQLTEG